MAQNRLISETSPYLLQHKDNPVHWHAWGDEALALAKAEGKPILLSVGYSACHWCHVMAHESFEDPDTAALMNEKFINIKVDREERPDLDVIYQSSLALMGQQGGWPLTMFLTPDAKPFWGGTYFPPEERYGRAGFKDVLAGLSDAWETNRDKVTSNVQVISDALDALARPQTGRALDMAGVDRVAAAMLRQMDPIRGGFRGAPKFPQVPYLKFLWRAWQRTGSALYYDAVVTTVDHMAQGGIYDHLAGGFARYSTDEQWLVPHFEKMLYDNAQLISLMSEIYKQTGTTLLRTRVRETIDWALYEMKVMAGADEASFAFASALDADSIDHNGHTQEGAFYVWNEAEINTLLGSAAPLFRQTYGVTTEGNWPEGGTGANVLRRLTPYPGEPVVEAALSGARDKLLQTRDERPLPGRDDKVLADVNGLMIQALVDAAVTFKEDAWLETAETVFAFVCRNMTKDGRLARSWTEGKAAHRAVLDDLAQMSRASLSLFEATGAQVYLVQAEAWVAQADDLFWCDTDGGYCLSARDATDVITRSRLSADNALPNGNGTMADVLARLHLITGEDGYRAKALALVDSFPAENPDAMANMPTLLAAYELLANGTQVVIAGANGNARPLVDAALSAPGTLRVIIQTNGEDTTPGQPAHGKTAPEGSALAYVCRGGVCKNPVADASSLRKALKEI